jgi:hypothetical protein
VEIADAIEQVRRQVLDSLWKTATVSGTSGTKVIVSVDGGTMTLPRLTSYTPTTGDVVLLAARSGGWFVVGKNA